MGKSKNDSAESWLLEIADNLILELMIQLNNGEDMRGEYTKQIQDIQKRVDERDEL